MRVSGGRDRPGMTFPKMHLMNYESVTDYKSWEPARITSITMEPSLDDPWSELCVMKPLGAAYSINSNWVANLSPIGQFEGDKADALISYLFARALGPLHDQRRQSALRPVLASLPP